jgi:hypothetical protein
MAGYIGSKAVSVNTTSATISDDLAVGDDLTVTDDATIGGTLGVTGVLTTTAAAVFNGGFTSNGDTVTLASTNSTDPVLILKNTTNDAAASRLHFVKDRGAAGTDGSDIGEIDFIGDNDAQQQTLFGRIEGLIGDASDGSEGGRIRMLVASHDGEMTTGFEVKDGNAEDEIDVNIGNGTSSLTSVAGNIHVAGNASEFNGYATSTDAPIGVKSNSSHFAISIEENSGTETWQIGVDADGDLNFHNSGGGTPSVSFNDSGFVGINTTTTVAPLTVKSDTNARAIRVIGRSDDISEMDFMEADDSTVISRLQARATFFSIGSLANVPFVLRANNSDKVTVETNGDLTIEDGNLVIGTSGHGIDFSAFSAPLSGMTNELLDRYEEGTYSPVLTGASSGTDAGIGSYVIVGKLITVSVTFNSIGTGLSGNLSVNLPIAANPQGTLDMYVPVQWFALNWTSGALAQYGYIADGATSLLPYCSKDNESSVQIQGDALGTSTYMRFIATYEIA